jgi:hypothetical protein
MLFDDYRVEPANIIYASEYNPFEAYRQLFGAIDRYRDALRELGGCKVYVSPLSSKLLSIGALLGLSRDQLGAALRKLSGRKLAFQPADAEQGESENRVPKKICAACSKPRGVTFEYDRRSTAEPNSSTSHR